jgi:hypothetical protein
MVPGDENEIVVVAGSTATECLMGRARRGMAGLCALLLVGCSWLPPAMHLGRPKNAPPAPVTATPRSDVERVLAFADGIQGGTKESHEEELFRLKSRTAQSAEAVPKVELALLLGLPGHSAYDPARAASLCGEVARDAAGASPALRSLASYLQTVLAQQAKQDDAMQSLSQRVREEQRRADAAVSAASQTRPDDPGAAAAPAQGQQGLAQRLRDEQKRAEAMQAKHDEAIGQLTQKLKDEQRKSELLQQKLDALTSIEKNLIERQKVK